MLGSGARCGLLVRAHPRVRDRTSGAATAKQLELVSTDEEVASHLASLTTNEGTTSHWGCTCYTAWNHGSSDATPTGSHCRLGCSTRSRQACAGRIRISSELTINVRPMKQPVPNAKLAPGRQRVVAPSIRVIRGPVPVSRYTRVGGPRPAYEASCVSLRRWYGSGRVRAVEGAEAG